MAVEKIKVPDIGGAEDVEVIEILVSVGDEISENDSMIVLESDKAATEIPAPKGGVVKEILVKQGDLLSEGDAILELETAGEDETAAQDDVQDKQDKQQQAPAADKEPAEKPAAQQADNGGSKATAKAPSGGGSVQEVKVPDLGGAADVEVIDVLVAKGDQVQKEDGLITLETDKAAMDVPSPVAGTVKSIKVKQGDTVSEGSLILEMEVSGAETASSTEQAAGKTAARPEAAEESAQASQAADGEAGSGDTEGSGETTVEEIKVPDLGGAADVEIIDVLVAEGDEIEQEAGLITLETDKAAMDVPSPKAGKVVALKVKQGDRVSEGSLIMQLETVARKSAKPAAQKGAEKPPAQSTSGQPGEQDKASASAASAADSKAVATPDSQAEVYAGPAVRKLARELGVDLTQVRGSGGKNRIVKEDVQEFVKTRVQGGAEQSAAAGGAVGLPSIPDIDFSQFGEIEEVDMSRLQQLTAQNMSRNWLAVPHVTQFDEADVTELEDFRGAQKKLAEKKGVKLTPLPFIIKACALALMQYPQFNVSLHSSGKKLIQKKYVHIGVAVATPAGLMVPVVRNADRKSIWEIAAEIAELGEKAKGRKLKKEEMEGACFTVSSLGGIGGTGFTPIVNAPEVGILGVSKTSIKPVYQDGAFVPRKMLPFSLSYDHRAVNGVDGGQFCTYLSSLLSDIRMMVL